MSPFKFRRRGRPPHPDVLTPAEWGVLADVRRGLTNAEIGEHLGISVNTVRFHVSNMLAKLEVSDRHALAIWDGEPAVSPRTRGHLGFGQLAAVSSALAMTAGLAWVGFGRSPASEGTPVPQEPVATATPVAVSTPLGRDIPFVANGRQWARSVAAHGSTGLDSPYTTVQADGTIVFAANVGTYQSTADAGGGPLPVAGLTDIVLVGLSPDGSHLWSKLLGGPGDDYASDIAVANNGDILLSGTIEDQANLGSGPLQTTGGHPGSQINRDAFVARFDRSGLLRWVKTFGTEVREDGRSVAELPDGTIAFSGSSNHRSLDLGSVHLEAPESEFSFVAGLSADGQVEWAVVVPGSRYAEFAVDRRTGDIVVPMWATSVVDGGVVPGVNGLTRLSSTGKQLWWRRFDQGITGRGLQVAVDRDGSILLSGSFERPIDFGGGLLQPNDEREGYVARFNPDGSHLWSKRFSGMQLGVESLALTDSGDIWIGGGSRVARLNSQGNLISEMPLVHYGGDYVLGTVTTQGRLDRLSTLIVDSPATEDGEILIGGRFSSVLNLGLGTSLQSTFWVPNALARVKAP